MKTHDTELRKDFRLLLLENPNYFGNLGKKLSGLTPVLKKISDTHYEELTAVSYDPKTRELRAVVEVKQQTGYSGGPCTDGSKEYVRFYVDYGDGTWIDEGVVNTDVHDLPFDEPLCYGLALHLDPAHGSWCFQPPVLPKVRAILSWNLEPPAAQPDWTPVWGNRHEADVQLKPLFWWPPPILEHFEDQGLTLQTETLEVLLKALPAPVQASLEHEAIEFAGARQVPDLRLLKETYGDDVDDARLAFPTLRRAVSAQVSWPGLQAVLEPLEIDWSELWKTYKLLHFNTGYEEVCHVGLDRDQGVLHAAVHIKRRSGYSGDLCAGGSREYVAFHMDFGSGWQFMGTGSVVVCDIPEAPDEGLWYHVALPVDLTPHQKAWCQTGEAKVRAILAWDEVPTDQADFVARWGDWEQCHVEVRPLPKSVKPGKVVPILESVGGMPVATIGASGLANGVSPTGLQGVDSPFAGRIELTGAVANAPDYSRAGVSQLEYRLMVKPAGATGFEPCKRKQVVWVTEIHFGVPGLQHKVTLTPDPAEGWMPYLPDLGGPDLTSVANKLLAVYVPAEEGRHELYVEVRDPNASPATVTKSQTVTLEVDQSPPVVDVEITSGTGNCGMFHQGDVVEGTFSMSDRHGSTVDLTVTPTSAAGGVQPEIVGLGVASADYGGALQVPVHHGKWQLDTSGMNPCGYNIRVHGEDRTIVHSRHFGYDRWDIEGFCLLPAES